MRVMIIDDEQPCLDELEYLLMKHQDVEIVGAYTNPFEALPVIALSRPEAVFIDISMPNMNGIDLAQRIRRMDSTVQLVFVTAHSKLLGEPQRAPPFEYILKPVNKKRLEAVVEGIRIRLNKYSADDFS